MREIKDDRVEKEKNEIKNRGPYTMSNVFQHMNCIVVFSREKDSVLFCRRKKEPYAGLLNFVGGKVEPGKSRRMGRRKMQHTENSWRRQA